MTRSLLDQMLKLGFKPPAEEAPKSRPAPARPDRPVLAGQERPDRERTGQARSDARRAAPGRPASRPGQPSQRRDAGARPPPPARGIDPNAPSRPRPSVPARPGDKPRSHAGSGRPGAPRRPQSDIDLAKAYAIRAQTEKAERIAAEQAKQEQARQRREAKARLATLLKDRTLNVGDAEIARHFAYGTKIRRVYVTEPQLKALNAGELGVVQLDGRYLLVDAATLAEVETIFAPAVALKVDPAAPVETDPYADPRYQIPDDLVW